MDLPTFMEGNNVPVEYYGYSTYYLLVSAELSIILINTKRQFDLGAIA